MLDFNLTRKEISTAFHVAAAMPNLTAVIKVHGVWLMEPEVEE